MVLFCVISANSGSFRDHCVTVHVRYLISWWVLVKTRICNCVWFRGSVYVTVQNFVLLGKPLRRYFDLFQNGGRPPSWICYVHVWTTHGEYLVVFSTKQNLVEIDAVVSTICKCCYFMRLAWICLFKPEIEVFGGFYNYMWSSHIATSKWHLLCRSTPDDV